MGCCKMCVDKALPVYCQSYIYILTGIFSTNHIGFNYTYSYDWNQKLASYQAYWNIQISNVLIQRKKMSKIQTFSSYE